MYLNLRNNVFSSWSDILRISDKIMNNFAEIIGVSTIVGNFMTRSSIGVTNADVWNAGTGVGLIIHYALIHDT